MANPTRQEVKEWVKLFVSQQGNQTGLDGLDEILDVIIDVAWSGTPGPPPELDYCLQVDREQSFTDEQKQQGRDNLGIQEADTSKCLKVDRIQAFTNAEKIQGVANLGPQQILDAIKELAGTLKNKTIDADDNTIKDLTGKEVKDGYLVQAVPDDRYFYGWEYVTMPDVFTKSAADAPTVDIYAIQDGKMQLVDTGRISAGNLVRGSVIYARKDSVDGYYVDDSDIKFAGLELALKILGLVKALKATYLKVSTFTGVTGDTSVLYYLDTKYDAYEKGFYIFNGSAFVNVDQKCVQYVSTFAGVDGEADVLYYLDTDYSTFKAGFHRFLPASGSTPARFEPLLKALVQYVSTFTGLTGDPDVLYYLDTAYGDYKVGFYRFIPAAGAEPAKYVQLVKALVQYVSTFTGVTGDPEVLYYLDTETATHKVGFHRFVPASGATPSKFVSIGASVFTDVDELPDTSISKGTIYRVPYSYYDYHGRRVEKEDAVWYGPGPQCLNMAADDTNGLNIEGPGRSYQWGWDEVDDALIQQLITNGLVAVKSDPADALFLRIGDNAYAPEESLTEVDGGYKLYHNPTETDGEYLEIGGNVETDDVTVEEISGKLRSYAIIDITAFPSTGIRTKNLYRFTADYYTHNGTKVDSLTGYKVTDTDIYEVTSGGLLDKRTSTLTTWSDANIHAIVQQAITDGYIGTSASFEEAEFFGYPTDQYDNASTFAWYYAGSIWQNMSGTASGWEEVGGRDGGSPVQTDGLTIEEVSGVLQANAVLDVTDLPAADIKEKSIYRTRDVSYEYEGVQFPKSELVWYGPGPDCTSMDADDIGVNIRAASGNRSYPWGSVNAALIQELRDLNLVAFGVDEADAVFFSHLTTYGPKSGLTAIYGDYHLYHNPSQTAGGYIEIGSDGEVFTDVNALPSTDISSKTIYRIKKDVYIYEGAPVPIPTLFQITSARLSAGNLGLTLDGTTEYAWSDVNDALIHGFVADNLVQTTTVWADRSFMRLASGNYVYLFKVSKTEGYELYHNPTATAGAFILIGGSETIPDGVTAELFDGHLQANALIDVDFLPEPGYIPEGGIKKKSVYRLRTYTYSHNGAPVPPEDIVLYCGAGDTMVSGTDDYLILDGGPTPGVTTHPWAEVTDTLIAGYIAAGYMRVTGNFTGAAFGRYGENLYDKRNNFTRQGSGYALYHNPTGTVSGFIAIGGEGSVTLDDVTTETVDGKVQANAIIEVAALPTAAIKAKTIYRMPVDKYYEDGNVLPATPTGYVSIRPAIVIIDENGITDNGTFYAWADITDAQMDFWVIRRQISEVYAADLMTNSTCFKTAANHYVYKDHVTKDQVYELYHNPTATANAFIKIGGEGGSVEVDEVTTEEVNGKVQANAVIVVNTLPTTGIKTKSIYRRMTQVYRHDGVEVNSVSPYKVRPNDTLDATPDGLWYKPSGPTVAWTDSNIATVVSDGIVGGYIEATTWENADFFGYGDDPTSGNFDYKNHFSRLLPGSLWQNPTGTAAGWQEVGKDPVIDEVTIVEENSILQAVAVIDVTTLPSAGMKVNSLYRKVETVMVPGLHIYTTYYHGGADPVPEPVECYKPARAGVEFRTNEIYIDSVQHSYEELKVYKADWVAAGYIVACGFLDIDTTTNDGAVGYPNEGSYQFLNRARYTYNTDPVPVVMNKIFQWTPGGEWESISTVQISNAAYNELDYDQKMDGTTYIVEG